ncbi:MAG: hypothetical protein GX959_05430 [Clostridiales bacterium]|jgi:5'-nucleotidase|nr:hypothetical protein [Clostridiales bacterium]
MRILMVNDDGYSCPGLVKLASILAKKHEVRVVAPHKCNSGMSAAVTFHKPIFIREITGYPYLCYSVTGTPSDCVKIGVELFATIRPELIISGINTDFNIGTDVFYSGTANAAIEGSLNNIPSLAISTKACEEQFDYVVDTFLKDFDYYISLSSSKYALNININNEAIGNIGKVICKLGKRQFCDIYLIDHNVQDGFSCTLVGNPIPIENDIDTDVVWLSKGYTTITPICYNSTDFRTLESLKRKILLPKRN